jgi:hypothetical protein
MEAPYEDCVRGDFIPAAAVFDESTGRAMNDRARVLIGEEPRGYDECSSLDEAIHAAEAREAHAPLRTPASYDEWAELLAVITADTEKPARPAAVDALQRALTNMREQPVDYIDGITKWLSARMSLSGDMVRIV